MSDLKKVIDSAISTNYDLDSLAERLGIDLTGILFKDQLFDSFKRNVELLYNGRKEYLAYIINMEDAGDEGSHWVAIFLPKKERKLIYFDSFGLPPPMAVYHCMRFLNRSKSSGSKSYRLIMNAKKIQKISSGGCGQYCIMFIYYMLHKKSDYETALVNLVSDFD